MAITTRDGWIASLANTDEVLISRTTARVAVAAAWFSTFDLTGVAGGGTLAGSSTAAGVVPTDATVGCPSIGAFTGANIGYVNSFEYGNTVAARCRLFDMLFKAGAYAFNANTTLAAQPSYVSRVPSGDYRGTQIWIETVTAFTGNLSVTITYTNQDGTAARTTGAFAPGLAPTVGRCFLVPLQAGDTGAQKIESVISTTATVGTFNVLVLRPLCTARSKSTNDGETLGVDRTALPIVFTDSALISLVSPDSTSTGVYDLVAKVING